MAVLVEMSRDIVSHELDVAKDLIGSFGWTIEPPKDGVFIAKLVNPNDSQVYILECQYDNYKEWPILYDFVDPDSGEKGTRHAYPVDKRDSIFHTQGPCICLEASRKAYGTLGGPHSEWAYENWIDLCNKSKKGCLTEVGGMLAKIAHHLIVPDIYNGRMG